MKNTSSIKPTRLDFVILGLISNESRTGYAIRKEFETTALGNFSSSPGTIYPALKRLQKLNFAEKRESTEDGKDKFHITSDGKLALNEWLIVPITLEDVMKDCDGIILRFAFMDSISDNTTKITFLESFRDALTTYLTQLQEFHSQEKDNLPLHGRLAFEYGIDSYTTTLKWCKKTLHLFNQN